MINYYEIGQRIRKYRKACNMSQEQLAEKVSISTTHLSHIETGNTKLSLLVFIEISRALQIQTEELLQDFPMHSRTNLKNEIIDILNGCSVQELNILLDVLKSTNISLKKYL